MKLRLRHAAPVLALALPLSIPAHAAPRQDLEPTFDPAADAGADIAEALSVAAKKNQRVLIVWGHDGTPGCAEFVSALRGGEMRRFMLYEYRTVYVDVGDRDRNLELAAAREADLKEDLPHATVLDASGGVLANRPASAWMRTTGLDSAAVKSFLDALKAEPQDAEEVLASALADAKEKNRRVFVHLGAPW